MMMYLGIIQGSSSTLGPGEALLGPLLQRSKAGLGLRETVRPGAWDPRSLCCAIPVDGGSQRG